MSQIREGEFFTEDYFRGLSAEYLKRHPEYRDAEDALNHIAIEQEKQFLTADAEEAKQTGGMVAFGLRTSDAQMLVVPGWEPVEDLHCTAVFLGKPVEPGIPQELVEACDAVADVTPVINARIFSRAEFNPDTEDTCAVYLLNSEHLDMAHDTLVEEICRRGYSFPEQHRPWIPHITIGYGLDPSMLSYIGDIVIDKILIEWAGETMVWNLFE